jgi:hypothetical protein
VLNSSTKIASQPTNFMRSLGNYSAIESHNTPPLASSMKMTWVKSIGDWNGLPLVSVSLLPFSQGRQEFSPF